MSSTGISEYAKELIAERDLTADEVWHRAEARLDWPIAKGLNSAHESSDRWAADRARLALIECHPDGSSRRWTFADLSQASARLATAWRAAGIGRGDRVASLLGQQAEAYIAALAAWRCGAVYQPLFAGFGPEALAQRINGGEPSAIIVDAKRRDHLTAALDRVNHDLAVYTVAGAAGRGLVHGDRSVWAEIDTHPADAPAVETAPSDPATLLYTSGTTGAPKGCTMPHSVVLAVQPFVRHVLALEPSDLLFSGANPGWAYGLYAVGFGVMALGHPRVIYTGDFDPHAWLRVIAEQGVTFLAAAPSALRRLHRAALRDGMPASVRGATCAGEPLDAPLARAWREMLGSDLQDGYGQSEAAMVLADLAHDDREAVPGALSSVLPGHEVAILDADGAPQDGEGTLALHKPRYQTCTGYWKAEELWAKRWRGDYFLTGDIVRRDGEGRYWFVGRDDDLIVTSGYNVGPTEVENVLLGHDGVAEAAAVAAPDAERGSVVRAVIVLNGQVSAEQVAAELRAAVADKLGRHAAPRIVDFVDELPRTETGKIRRAALRHRADVS
jgi:acetyl-CoA synthetase